MRASTTALLPAMVEPMSPRTVVVATTWSSALAGSVVDPPVVVLHPAMSVVSKTVEIAPIRGRFMCHSIIETENHYQHSTD
jgi:hypothetical protein